jgi:hypothetical protein
LGTYHVRYRQSLQSVPISRAILGRIMSSFEEYKKYADECLAWAKTAKTERERTIFLEMAKAWMEAATVAKGNTRPRKSPSTSQDEDKGGNAVA